MVQDLETVNGVKNVEETMNEAEKKLFNDLKEALLSKQNISRNEAGLEYNFKCADCEVLLGQIRHSCLGCYSGDVGYIKDCHHSINSDMPCSLWQFRGGKVNRNEIMLKRWDGSRRDYAVGVPDDQMRITEIFLYITECVSEPKLMFRYVPQKRKSITELAAYKLADKAYYSICDNGVIPEGWEEVPNNEG